MNATPAQAAFEESRRRAHAALRAGRAATAERWLRALEAQFPGEVNCQWLLGVALLDQEKIPESIATLERAARARARLRPCARGSGARVPARRPCRAGTRGSARGCWKRSRTIIARGSPTAMSLVDLDQYDDARIAFERARLTDPERARIEAATAALVADDRKKSEGIFREILQTDPSHVAALVGLAALSLAADRPHDAERLLRHALKQSEHVPLAWRGLGPALIALGSRPGGRSGRASRAEGRARKPAVLDHGRRASRRGLLRQEEALEAYEKAARLKPEEVRLRMSIGHVHKTLGRRQRDEACVQGGARYGSGASPRPTGVLRT